MRVFHTIEGFKELDNLLKTLPGNVAARVSTTALKAGGRIIAKEAKAKLRNNRKVGSTGNLAQSIKVYRDENRRSTNYRAVKIGPFGKGSAHKLLVEFGTTKIRKAKNGEYLKFKIGNKTIFTKQVAPMPAKPYLRPAFDQKKVEALSKIAEITAFGVTREVLKRGIIR